VCVVAAHAGGADNSLLERLALCQDSWLDWKEHDPARLKNYANAIKAGFTGSGHEAWVTPRSSQSVAGLRVIQVYPESVGMGVGFSVLVEASFARVKKIVEQRLGRSFGKCEPPSDNMRTCDMPIADKKTVGVMSEDSDKATRTLISCYYFYAK